MFNSQLHDETTFYRAFIKDLEHCEEEVFIESPFITTERINMLKPVFEKLLRRKVKIYILTRRPTDHDEFLEYQSAEAIEWCEVMGVQPLLCDNNSHRKLAILDRKVLWEGSLNILSQTHSREFMRRIDNKEITLETFEFLDLEKFF